MEHRYQKRIPLCLDVMVLAGDCLKLRARSRDISTEGMFIELVGERVPINTVVDIEHSYLGCLPGLVVHTEGRGIGVMFRSAGRAEKERLGQLLSGEWAERTTVPVALHHRRGS